MRYTTFALQRRIYPKVTNWKFADLETGLTIAGVGFLQWKACHHDDQPGGGRSVSEKNQKLPYFFRNSSTKS